MQRGSQPHAIWQFARAQDAARGLAGEDAARLAALLDRCGGSAIMQLTTNRRIERKNNVLVLG